MRKNIINESQESKSQSEAIKLVMDKLGYDYEQANNFVRKYLRNEITSLRDKNIAKFTLGVARMYCDRQITDTNTISDLNATLKMLSAHINEYDRNLNGISAQELIQRFEKVRVDNFEKEKNEINDMTFENSDYEIIKINSYDDAKKYYTYTNPNSRWCLTYRENMFNAYTNNGFKQTYFCLKNGFENVPCETSENAPLDEYGLSMLSIIVNEHGKLSYCTTRWNDENGGNDNSMSAKQISEVVGVNFYETFKPNNKWKELISSILIKLKNGASLSDVFDGVYDIDSNSDIAIVKLNNKFNIIKFNNIKFISDKWFDYIFPFQNGFGQVMLNNQYNYINKNGEIISDKWFDKVWDFNCGHGIVKLDGKYNYVNMFGKLISKQWFDYANDFKNGFGEIEIKGKRMFIDNYGKIYDKQPNVSESIKRIYFNEKHLTLLKEYYSTPDQTFYDGVCLNHTDSDAYSFGVIDGKLEVGDKQSTHGKIISTLSANKLGFDNATDLYNTIEIKRNYDEEEADDLEFKFNSIFDELYYQIEEGISGRFWEKREVLSFWNDIKSDDIIFVVNELKKHFNNNFPNLKIVNNGEVIDYDSFIQSNNSTSNDKDVVDQIRNIHLANQNIKRKAFSNFKRVRGERDGKKLGNMTMAQYHNLKTIGDDVESKETNLSENLELEVEPSDVDLSSFEKQNELNPHFWENDKLNSKVRIQLLNIADDFYKTLGITFIKPEDIILCGSICNYNWSIYSDVDIHILLDFSKISDNNNIIKDYFNMKKNEWNNEHDELTIYGLNVEFYVQDINDDFVSSGIYSLENDKWINKPSFNEIFNLSNKRQDKISKIVADIMTKIDDYYVYFDTYKKDNEKLELLSIKIDKLFNKLKEIRNNGLEKNGELSLGNIVYKAIRRANYFDKLWDLKIKIYDKINSI